MGWFKKIFGSKEPEQIDESLKSFKNKGKNKNIQGEGYEDIQTVMGFGLTGTESFNMFYNKHINKQLKTDKAKLAEYRKMADMPEISDVIDNAVIEATSEDENGKVINLDFISEEISKNKNIVKNLEDEFNKLFYEKINIKSVIQDYFKSYLIDGKLFLENVINKGRPSFGILGIKKLPAETMDYDIDPSTGKIIYFYQFLKSNAKKPTSIEEAEKEKDVILFYPAQITYIDSGIYGVNKKDVLGYLHRCRQPFNQLRLLETSVVIYRLIRSPERLVFRIDTGNMPKDKGMKYVEKIKNKFTKKQVYDPNTGSLSNSTDVNSVLENYFLAQCLRMNTKISLMNGQEKTLKEIIDDFNNGINNQVYSVDQKTGKIIKGDIEWAGITRKNAELMRVWFDNNEFVDVTPDHKFVLRDGREVEAQNLKSNDSLMSLHRRNKDEYYDLKDNEWKNIHIKEQNNYTHFKEDVRYNHKVVKVEMLPFKEDTGCLTIKDAGENHNFALSVGVFVKNSSDGRGSTIESIGGNPSGFSELDDIYYFQKKLYRSLKYPMSRVSAAHENRNSDIIIGGNNGEIARDEIKWAKFLEFYQKRICDKLLDLFIIHLEFIGLSKQYELNKSQFQIKMNPPNNYLEDIRQTVLQKRFDNYSALANFEEFSKTYLMRKYLNYDDEDMKKIKQGFEEDKEILPSDDSGV